MPKLSQAEAEQLLYLEARLLDERKLDDWLTLFTADGLYWLPIADGADPEREPSLIYDDADLRGQRVYALLHTPHWSQMPPSRTVHSVTNVEVEQTADHEALVRCNLVVFELRPGHPQQFGLARQTTLAGRCEYRLRHEAKWAIALKKVLLINADMPQFNLTYLI